MTVTKPVFPFANLKHSEFLSAGTQHNQSLNFIVYFLRIVRCLLFPIGSQSCDEFFPIDQTSIISVEHIRHVFHFQSGSVEFGFYDAVDEIVSRNQLVVILIHFSEQISQPGFFVIHKFKESFSPIVPREVVGFFFFFQISQMIVEFPLTFPGEHPHMSPFVVQEFDTR